MIQTKVAAFVIASRLDSLGSTLPFIALPAVRYVMLHILISW